MHCTARLILSTPARPSTPVRIRRVISAARQARGIEVPPSAVVCGGAITASVYVQDGCACCGGPEVRVRYRCARCGGEDFPGLPDGPDALDAWISARIAEMPQTMLEQAAPGRAG